MVGIKFASDSMKYFDTNISFSTSPKGVGCVNDLQTCGLVITIDFGFNLFVHTGKSHPNYRQQFAMGGTIHGAIFTFSNNKYCFYAFNQPCTKKPCQMLLLLLILR